MFASCADVSPPAPEHWRSAASSMHMPPAAQRPQTKPQPDPKRDAEEAERQRKMHKAIYYCAEKGTCSLHSLHV